MMDDFVIVLTQSKIDPENDHISVIREIDGTTTIHIGNGCGGETILMNGDVDNYLTDGHVIRSSIEPATPNE